MRVAAIVTNLGWGLFTILAGLVQIAEATQARDLSKLAVGALFAATPLLTLLALTVRPGPKLGLVKFAAALNWLQFGLFLLTTILVSALVIAGEMSDVKPDRTEIVLIAIALAFVLGNPVLSLLALRERRG